MLKDSGSFFLQINGDSLHLHRIAVILDEVFGAENRVTTITWLPTNGSSSNLLPEAASYILWYAKDKECVKYNRLYEMLQSRKEVVQHMSSYAMVGLPTAAAAPSQRRKGRTPIGTCRRRPSCSREWDFSRRANPRPAARGRSSGTARSTPVHPVITGGFPMKVCNILQTQAGSRR